MLQGGFILCAVLLEGGLGCHTMLTDRAPYMKVRL